MNGTLWVGEQLVNIESALEFYLEFCLEFYLEFYFEFYLEFKMRPDQIRSLNGSPHSMPVRAIHFQSAITGLLPVIWQASNLRLVNSHTTLWTLRIEMHSEPSEILFRINLNLLEPWTFAAQCAHSSALTRSVLLFGQFQVPSTEFVRGWSWQWF